jgi:hypothetical protein
MDGYLFEVYKRLKQFIKLFFDWLYPASISLGVIDLTKVEINRLDFCYNQFFQTKYDALNYLTYQKRLRKKFTREFAGGRQSYETSIFYQTDRYSVKVYHKGAEYQKKDRVEHEKINKRALKKIIDSSGNEAMIKAKEIVFKISDKDILTEQGLKRFEGLSSVAERILRYELTCRNSYISYLYRNNIWRNKTKEMKELKQDFNEVTKMVKRIDRLLKLKRFEEYQKLYHEFLKIPKYKKLNSQKYENVINQRVKFMVSKSREMDIFNNEWHELEKTKNGFRADCPAHFNFEVFKLIFKKFNEFFEDFQIKEKTDISEFLHGVKNFNDNVKKYNEATGESMRKVNAGGLNSFVLLLQTHTMDEIKAMKIIPDRTFFYYKSKLKKLGVFSQSVGDYLPRCSKDYVDYHSLTFTNNHFHDIKNQFFK